MKSAALKRHVQWTVVGRNGQTSAVVVEDRARQVIDFGPESVTTRDLAIGAECAVAAVLNRYRVSMRRAVQWTVDGVTFPAGPRVAPRALITTERARGHARATVQLLKMAENRAKETTLSLNTVLEMPSACSQCRMFSDTGNTSWNR